MENTFRRLVEQSAENFGTAIAFQIREESGEYRKYSFKETSEIAGAIQQKLAAFGAAKGDRVALISENRPEWAIAYLAVTSLGAIVVPLDAMLQREEILPLIDDAEPKAVILSQKFSEFFRGTKVEAAALLMEEVSRLPRLPGQASAPVNPDDIASLVYTSGTTGKPKGVMLTHRNIMSNVAATAELFHLGPGDNFLSVLPLHHTFETTAGFLGPFYKGCAITFAESLKSHNILRNMQETGVTVMCGVPLLYKLFYEGILREVEEKKLTRIFEILFAVSRFFRNFLRIDIGRLLFSTVQKKFGGRIHFFVTGGAPIDPLILKNFELMGFTIVQGYGLTEASPILTCNTLKENLLGSVGKALPGVQVKIAGGESSGEIIAFGPNIMAGYYRRPDLTAEVIDEKGWLHTGDVGHLDKNGYLFITGRIKDVIVTPAGMNVYPEELEFSLNKLPSIRESCVLGLNVQEGLRRGWEEVAAVIVPKKGYSDDAVREEIEGFNKRVAEYKRIARIFFRKEDLPKTRLLKIKRFLLRKEMGL